MAESTHPQTPGSGKVPGLAVAAITLAFFGLLIPLVGIVALIVGMAALEQVDRADGAQEGQSMARTAVILGCIGTTLWIVLGLLGIQFAATTRGHRPSRTLQNSTQVNGVIRGCILYAQGNGEHYPGMDSSGNLQNATVPQRFELLLQGNYLTSEYMISPSETDPSIVKYRSGSVTSSNYSYSMLSIADPGSRRAEWYVTTNSQAAVVSDRNIGGAVPTQYQSIHYPHPGQWRGSVGWNDNHTELMTTPIMPITKYDQTTIVNDDLFAAISAHDALMIHDGQ
ncbi:MAG: DUF4190 domain-containing protein [Phycisphaeraceae bacterium]